MNKQGWEVKKLGDICEILDSQRKPITKKDRQSGRYPYFGATGIQDYVADYIFDGTFILVGEDGAKWGANDRTAFLVEGKCWVNNHVHVLKIKEEIINRWVIYYLNNKDLNGYITGAVVPKLNQASLRNIPIPVPTFSIQEQIVKELDMLSEIIEKKKKQLTELDTLAQATFYEMFGDPLKNERGWEVKKLGSFSQVGTGATPNRKKGNIYFGGNIPWVKTTEVCGLGIKETEEYITEQAMNDTNCKLFPVNAILLAMYGQGKTRGQVGLLKVEATTNQACAAIVPEKSVNYRFLYLYLKLNYHYIRSLGRGGSQENLNLSLVRSIPVILPPPSFQNQFAERIEKIEKQKTLIEQSIADVQQLFDSAMDKYFH